MSLSASEQICVRIGARSPPLSRAQVDEVWSELRAFFPSIHFETSWFETTGDRDRSTSLRALEKTDFFTKEIDQALLKGECDAAIHSAKDLPDPLPKGLAIAAITTGVDPSDSLVLPVGKTLADLSHGAQIGTSSARREYNIQELRSDLRCVDVRGSILERLQLLETGQVDGLVVAEAALIRLQLTHLNRIQVPGERAALQGQLAIVVRQNDEPLCQLFSVLEAKR